MNQPGSQGFRTTVNDHFPAHGYLYGELAPKVGVLTDKVLYGGAWERPGLSERGRSLVKVSTLTATNRPGQLCSHCGLRTTTVSRRLK
jgi:alkylhydroperoxidase/carboxymuconolactone decarboxylase family protein YurZ